MVDMHSPTYVAHFHIFRRFYFVCMSQIPIVPSVLTYHILKDVRLAASHQVIRNPGIWRLLDNVVDGRLQYWRNNPLLRLQSTSRISRRPGQLCDSVLRPSPQELGQSHLQMLSHLDPLCIHIHASYISTISPTRSLEQVSAAPDRWYRVRSYYRSLCSRIQLQHWRVLQEYQRRTAKSQPLRGDLGPVE